MLIFSSVFLFVLIFPFVIDGRMDDDTEFTNDSFNGTIENLHGDFHKCKINVDGQMITATAKVNPPFKMPTCLKEYYEMANMRGCGMPLYKKFRYCAKALFFGNRRPDDIDFKAKWNEKRQILVLLDGCLACPKYPERAANVTIKLLSGYFDVTKPLATTHSDRFADFKIGAIIEVKGKFRQIQPQLEIVHYCNQYHVRQRKILTFPAIYPLQTENLVFENTLTTIPLPQRDENDVTVDLLA